MRGGPEPAPRDMPVLSISSLPEAAVHAAKPLSAWPDCGGQALKKF